MILIDVEVLARRIGVEPGWVWLHENGFEHRVPDRICERIEEAKPGVVDGKPPQILERPRRGRPRKYADSTEAVREL